MTTQLAAGDVIAADYTLLHPIQNEDKQTETWLAIQTSTQERVELEPLALANLDAARIQLELDSFKRLVHPNVLLSYKSLEYKGSHFLVSAYRRGLQPLNLSQPLDTIWPALQTIIEALQYAHSLGFIHGGIAPASVVTGDDGTAYLRGFGYGAIGHTAHIAVDTLPTEQSDVYGIAQLICECLTGAPWQKDESHRATRIQPDLENLLRSMVADSPMNRPSDFKSLLEFQTHSSDREMLEASEFTRVETNDDGKAGPNDPRVNTEINSAPSSQHKLPRERRVVSLPLAIMGLLIIAGLAAALFLFLPEFESNSPSIVKQREPAASPTVDAADPEEVEAVIEPAPLELAKLAELKERGKTLAEELLRRQVAVEDVGGRLWAGSRYDDSSALGIEGDELYREEQYQQAFAKYTAGVDLLGEVLAETEQVFTDNLSLGEAALLNGDSETAISAYETLTRIKPDDSSLARALARAKNLEQVVRLTKDALVMERNGDLVQALDSFRAATSLDGEWTEAAEGIRRINNQLARVRFQDAMSKGFAAISNEDFDVAEEAFNSAQAILPNSEEPLDGLQQIELAKVQANIRALEEQVRDMVSAGNWQDSIAVYEEILSITPGLSTATRGLEQAQQRADMTAALAKYIEQPQLMQTDEGLKSATSTLLAANQAGEAFKSEARKLSHLVSLARIEVQVKLESDNRTDVTVYQVGSFGNILEANLSLIPGVYTFVGKRPGFRDVYREIHIKGDLNPVVIEVRCSERI